MTPAQSIFPSGPVPRSLPILPSSIPPSRGCPPRGGWRPGGARRYGGDGPGHSRAAAERDRAEARRAAPARPA